MSQIMGAVNAPTNIEHGILVDLTIPTAVYITNCSGSGGVVTITFQDPGFVPFEGGTTVVVSGVSPASYNGTYTVLDSTETQATFLSPITATYEEGGQARGVDRKFYISNCYNPIQYNGKIYQALAGFLEISNLQQDLITTNNEISLSLSAIPPEYIENIIGQQIKGGAIRLYRVFFDPDTKQIQKIDGVLQVFKRFQGIITNWAVSESLQDGANGNNVEVTHTISISCSSTIGVLQHRIAGRRTNNANYQVRYNERYFSDAIITDRSFSRIDILKNASFDFGKPVK